MFIGIVLAITIASISILSVVNTYYISFVENFGDINEYYSSRYATISAIERWLNTRDKEWNIWWTWVVTGTIHNKNELLNEKTWIWTWSSPWETLSGTVVSGSAGDFASEQSFNN